MATAPYGVRLLVGAAVTAIEETRKLPQTILMYPMTLASQLAHLVMKVQQDLADLVNKGDETLDQLFPPKEEQPEWATFDEDLDDNEPGRPSTDGERLTEGRFALFTGGGPDTADPKQANGTNLADADPPDIVADLDYQSLTLAQLRARLSSLRVPDLEALLAYEERHQVARTVPDPAGQQDHPRDRQVTASPSTGQVRREPMAGACRRHPRRQVDRPARHRLGRGPARPRSRSGGTPRPCSWCCATRPPTCR